MPLPAGAHVKIGDKHYRLDESQEAPYRRFSRSIFADIPIVGTVGQNLQPGRLVWNQTNFDGEGQTVLDASDADSARRFYKSSGLDFKTAGQFQLNRAAELTLPTPTGSSDTTVQGNAGMTDVTGTSTADPTFPIGETWTSETSGTSNGLQAVVWSGDQTQYVTVGNSGTILTSPDGSAWTSRTSGTTSNLLGVAYANSTLQWMAVGPKNTIYRSTNSGSTWSSTSLLTTSVPNTFQYDIAWDATAARFVMVGTYMNSSGTENARSYYTSNGTSFTAVDVSAFTNFDNVSAGNGLYVAFPGTSTSSTYYTSTDGSSWTSRTGPTSGQMNRAHYSSAASLWVAVGNGGKLWTSTSGTSWTSRTSGVTTNLNGVTYAGGTWIAVGASGTIITSTDGTTWTSRTSGISTNLNAVSYSSTLGKVVAVGAGGVVLSSSGGAAASTDRQLNAINDVVKTSSNHTPGAYTVTVAFHAYRSNSVNVAGGANPTVTLSVYNVTDSTTTTSTTAVLSSTSTSTVATLSYTGATGKDYSYRVTWTSGTGYKPIVDKIVYTVPSSSSIYTHDAIQLGQGGNVWVAASSTTAATSTTTYTYNFSNNTWTTRVTPASTAGKKPLAMAHTDKYQYVLLDNSIVYQATTAAVNAYIAATTATARGIAITQNRLFVLGEDDTNGVVVYLYGIDQTSLPVSATNSVTVDNGKNSPDVTLRQRMTSSPSGAVFFVNYSTRGVVYECDASGSSPVVTILAELPEGVKATSILHTGGLTFVAAQFLAPTGKSPRSALFMIDQNGVIQRVGWFRRDDPNTNPVIAMQAYQNDLWMLQGGLLWRYSLTTGGLFLEHDFAPASPSTAHGLAVTQDYAFAAYDAGIYVVGKLTNYLTAQSGSLTSSVYDFGLPYEDKLLQSIEVTTYQLPANSAVQVEYQVDQNGIWVLAGTSYAGTSHFFRISDANYATRFHTLQIRTTPVSTTGTATPVVKGVTAQCYTTTTEQLFDLTLLTTDEDSETSLGGEDRDGSDLAAYVWDLYDEGNLVTLLDGYTVGDYEEPTEYLCKIESIDHINLSPGEGSVRVRLRVVT